MVYYSSSIIYSYTNTDKYYKIETHGNFCSRTIDPQHTHARNSHDIIISSRKKIQLTINKMPYKSIKVVFGANERVVLMLIEFSNTMSYGTVTNHTYTMHKHGKMQAIVLHT